MTDTDETSQHAAWLALTEWGLGSLLHALHFPLTGQFLSLNQAFILSRLCRRARAREESTRAAPATASLVAALVKTLAPAGKKLTPMLAISAQGVLFNLGTTTFGAGIVGCVTGALLLSVWAFAQPVLIQYLVFGEAFFTAVLAMATKLEASLGLASGSLVALAIAAVVLKAMLAAGAALLAFYAPEAWTSRYERRTLAAAERKREALDRGAVVGGATPVPLSAHARGALRDLRDPWFVLSLALVLAFFFFAEGPNARLIWVALRPLAVGFVVFFAVRAIPLERLVPALRRLGWSETARTLERTLIVIRAAPRHTSS